MRIDDLPLSAIDWPSVPKSEPRERGVAYWWTRYFGPIRVRYVEYTPGFLADPWCIRGRILCLEGEFETELADGSRLTLTPGMSYQVADNARPHRSSTLTGARLFIVD
jgi:hypothetical protein